MPKKVPQFDKTKFNKKKMRRSDGKKPSNYYWTKEHEDAIVEYPTANQVRRNELYNKLLSYAFDQMIDNIVFTYKFTYLPNIVSLKEECKHDLIKILTKFDPNRGSKAFAYFSVITKNNFIHLVKKYARVNVAFRHLNTASGSKIFHYKNLTVDHEYENARNSSEKLEYYLNDIENWKWEMDSFTDNEKKVYEAFVQIYQNADKLEIVNLKAIRLYLKEITGLNSKEITSAILKMKNLYLEMKNLWLNED